MPRLEATFANGRWFPVIEVTLSIGDHFEHEVLAIVDSGADSTLVPGELVEAAGIPFASLEQAEALSAGGQMTTAKCLGSISYLNRTFCTEFACTEPGKRGNFLLGRADFFRSFVVRFLWHRDPPVFDIDPVT